MSRGRSCTAPGKSHTGILTKITLCLISFKFRCTGESIKVIYGVELLKCQSKEAQSNKCVKRDLIDHYLHKHGLNSFNPS